MRRNQDLKQITAIKMPNGLDTCYICGKEDSQRRHSSRKLRGEECDRRLSGGRP